MLSGKVVPFVSGSNKHTSPATRAATPNMAVGIQGTLTTVSEIKGANIDPILIEVELAPIAMFLTTVGYSSEVYM